MTTQADIKRVIDQLNNLDCVFNVESELTINAAITTLETLGNQKAEMKRLYQNEADVCESYKAQTVSQAAVIEKLRDTIVAMSGDTTSHYERAELARKALSIPTDSTQILQEWLDSVLGEPVTYVDRDTLIHKANGEYASFGDPLFKKPELIK